MNTLLSEFDIQGSHSYNKKLIILISVFIYLFLTIENAEAASLVSKPIFSVPSGLYTEEFDLTITTNTTDAEIYYTLDGSVPYPGNTTTYQYTAPLRIRFQPAKEQTFRNMNYFYGTVLRAIAVAPDRSISDMAYASYFLDKDMKQRFRLPIISIITDNANLYDSKTGIMSQANTQSRGSAWERPIHFEYFDKLGQSQISMNAGIRLHGGASRDWAFKSFRIYARSEYDTLNRFSYDFFSDSVIPALVNNGLDKGKPITEFKRLILRSGGNEGTAGDGILFRDALSQALMVNTSLDLQAYQPAITFLNGEFYGIHNIRERQDEKYIEDHYNVDENKVIIYEFDYDDLGTQVPMISSGEESDLAFYNTMLDFIRTKDLSRQENYHKVQTWLDIENFVDYQIINIYGANRDWPGNNCKAWRVRTEYNPEAEYGLDGRLRWLVYDMDFNFGLYNPGAVNLNSLSEAMEAGNTAYPNPDGSTLILRKLLENEEFKIYFCQRFLDLLNTNFDKDYASDLIDTMASNYRISIDELKARYGLLHDWEQNLLRVKDFITKRDAICKIHLSHKFDLGSFYFLSIDTGTIQRPSGGSIKINTVIINERSNGVQDGVWKKSYYTELPTVVTAIPDEGYEFIGWSGSTDSKEPTLDASSLANNSGSIILKPMFSLADNKKDKIKDNTTEVVSNATLKDQDNNTVIEDTTGVEHHNIYLLSIIILVFVILLLFCYFMLHRRNEQNKKN